MKRGAFRTFAPQIVLLAERIGTRTNRVWTYKHHFSSGNKHVARWRAACAENVDLGGPGHRKASKEVQGALRIASQKET